MSFCPVFGGTVLVCTGLGGAGDDGAAIRFAPLSEAVLLETRSTLPNDVSPQRTIARHARQEAK
jgi:hypothetical protein